MIIYSDGLYPQRHQDFETICISLLKQEKKHTCSWQTLVPGHDFLGKRTGRPLNSVWHWGHTGEARCSISPELWRGAHSYSAPSSESSSSCLQWKKSWWYFSGVMNKDFSYKVRVWCTNCIHCIIWTWIVYCTSESGENSILFAKRICHWMFLFQLFLLEHTANVASFRKGFKIWGLSFWRCIPTYVKFFEIFEGSVDDHFILIWPDHRGHKHLQKVN